MKFGTTLRRSKSAHIDDDQAQRLRELRIEAARRNTYWTEVAETDFVRRGRLFVHAESDELFKPYRGAIFAKDAGRPTFNETVPLAFYVRDGELVFLERVARTWSEIVERRERRKHRV